MRLIDADVLIERLNKERKAFLSLDMKGAEHVLVHSAFKCVWEAPTIDAVPVRHGRWVDATRDDPCYYCCSECGKLMDFEENYCPNCGARMDKEIDK